MANAKGKRAAARLAKAAAPMTKNQLARTAMRASIYRDAVQALAGLPEWTAGSEYSDELGEAIAAAVADGATLDQMATLPQCPPSRVMRGWIVRDDHPFRRLFYAAKELLVPLLEERAMVAATTTLTGVRRRRYQQITKDGDIEDLEETAEYDNVERSKLAVSTYAWALEHLQPRKWGRQADPAGQGNDALQRLLGEFRQRNGQINGDS